LDKTVNCISDGTLELLFSEVNINSEYIADTLVIAGL